MSEIQFGETSGGAAVVQGSYVGADQSKHKQQTTTFTYSVMIRSGCDL